MIGPWDIYHASTEGISKLKEVLKECQNIDTSINSEGCTALHLASIDGNFQAASLLIQHNAHVDIKSDNGQTPLHKAASMGRDKVVKLLLEKSSSINAIDRNKNTPLHLAIEYCDDLKTIRLLRVFFELNKYSSKYAHNLKFFDALERAQVLMKLNQDKA